MSWFSEATGMDDANNLRKDSEARAKQGYTDALQYRNAQAQQWNSGLNVATGVLNTANNQYGQMYTQGSGLYNALLNDYLRSNGLAGIQAPQIGGGEVSPHSYGAAPSPTAGFLGAVQGTSANPFASFGASGTQANPYAQPAGGNRQPVQTTGAAGVLNRNATGALAQPQQQQAANPYALSSAQQAQSNQAVDRYSLAANNAIQEYRAQLAQRGLPPNAAGEAEIQANLARMSEESKANFAEQARQQRSEASQQGVQWGLQQQQAGTSGQMSVAQLLEQFASNPNYLNLANVAQNQANMDTQAQIGAMNQSNAISGTLGTILGLGGNNVVNWAAGQLFPKKKSTPKA